jgi:thymidylate kinase
MYPIRKRRGVRDIALITAPLYSIPEVGRIIRSSARTPSIAAIHAAGAVIPIKLFARYLATHYEVTVIQAQYAADRLVRAGLPARQVKVVTPGVDLDFGVSRAVDSSQRPITFAFAGNASPERGADLLVRAFEEAFRDRADVRLTLAVRQDDERFREHERALRRIISRSPRKAAIEIRGDLSRPELRGLFRNSKAVVLPFRVVPSEGPLMPLEIGVAGGQLITTELPPLRGVSPPGAIFVPPGNVRDLVRALRQVAASSGRIVPRPGVPRHWSTVVAEVDQIVRVSAPTVAADRSRHRTIYIFGNDGTGKTTQAKLLAEALAVRGLDASYVWLRFPQLFSLPVLGMSRLLGVTKFETLAGRRTGYWEFWRARWLAVFLLWTRCLDAWLFGVLLVSLPARRGAVVILDRFVLDIIVDVAAAARDPSLLQVPPARLLRRLVPKGARVMLHLDTERIRDRRGDLRRDEGLEARSALYEAIARLVPSVSVIDADGSVESIHRQLLDIALSQCCPPTSHPEPE